MSAKGLSLCCFSKSMTIESITLGESLLIYVLWNVNILFFFKFKHIIDQLWM